jgi:L-ribulose-5-phosphate 3-epimerase
MMWRIVSYGGIVAAQTDTDLGVRDMAKLRIGVISSLGEGPRKVIEQAHQLGLTGTQLACWDPTLYTDAAAAETVEASQQFDVEVNTVWAGGGGTLAAVWNFYEGPKTIGIVPRQDRPERIAGLKAGADFAKKIGVRSITTHVGFIPEDPNDELYKEAVVSLKEVADYCADLGLEFWFETGQETPVTLLRTIQDVGAANMGINLDPANLLMYGKANPVDALDVFGSYVRGVHAKDGVYPTDGKALGKETPLGEGKVNFPRLLQGLRKHNFSGHLTIEREIGGPQQIADIKAAITMLDGLM